MPHRTAVRNYLLLSAGELAAKACTFFAYTSLGRSLGPERYGDIEFAISTTLFFALFVQFGLGAYGARELAKAPERARTLMDEVAALRLLSGGAAFLVVVGLATVVDKSVESKVLLLAYGVTLLEAPGLLIWYFQGREEMPKAALTSLVRHAVFAALALTVMDPARPLWFVGAFEICALAATVLVGAALAGRLPIPRMGAAVAHLRKSAGIGAAELAWAGLWFLPVVVYGFQVHDASVGWLGSAHRATLAIHTFVWWYFFNLLPSISRCAPSGLDELRALLQNSMRLTLWGGFGVAILTAALAQPLVRLAYGDAFGPAGELLSWMIWTIPLSVVSGHFRNVLLGFDRQRALVLCTLAAAAASAGTTAALAPGRGVEAAVVGLLAGNAVLALSTAIAVHKEVLAFGAELAPVRPLLATALAWAVLSAVRDEGEFASAAAAGVAFGLALLVLERRRLTSWIAARA